ncbi:hypothetical protein [Salimicrobium halophilum]|uniref:Uncharacterized protein n=1 Tax=Salimicrobium halophilum TaxID=86666 RepID=A0A1G8W5U7_9BACI|nr:hypothetical protein [Salimicrobium halophilum]SDJ73734.1 hypothetical protein SAMN04490247_3045 [Salimicrobium halophilum]
MYIYKRISFDGSNWRSKSINTESLFDEDPYKNQTLPGKEVKFTHEPVDEDYDKLCEQLSGEVTISVSPQDAYR